MHKGTVLSVDDDEGLQLVLREYLETEGYKVETASSGVQLTDKLNHVSSDIILLDLVLPDADGISLIAQIRAKTSAPILVISGKSDTTEKVVCLEMGADDYMTKPFEMRELSARIKAAMRRTQSPANTAANTNVAGAPQEDEQKEDIKFGRFILNRNQLQLFTNEDESLNITTGEFELLERLAMAPNRALSREQLFEATRDGNFDSYDRAIDIQIGRIRKKMGKDGNDIIKTIRGVGYMFCPPKE
jgi:DNA-binding response OmpR family regulator